MGTSVGATVIEPTSGPGVANVSTSNVTMYVISSKGNATTTPMSLDFSGMVERNLQYAENNSSIKVGQNGNWMTMSLPWLVRG